MLPLHQPPICYLQVRAKGPGVSHCHQMHYHLQPNNRLTCKHCPYFQVGKALQYEQIEAAGFEPAILESKSSALTIWLRPKSAVKLLEVMVGFEPTTVNAVRTVLQTGVLGHFTTSP